jgi:hypothetical protein
VFEYLFNQIDKQQDEKVRQRHSSTPQHLHQRPAPAPAAAAAAPVCSCSWE